MKLQDTCGLQFAEVAPHVGAWIEMSSVTLIAAGAPSPLTWGRGLKCAAYISDSRASVAPHVGAWIEIRQYMKKIGLPCRPSRGGVD